jgi:hypothetical protein
LGEELVGSYLYQVHLHHELEFHDYDRSHQATVYIYKVKRMVYLLGRSDFELGQDFCAAQLCPRGFLRGHLLGWLDQHFDRPNEAVALTNDGFHEARPLGIIVQRPTDFSHDVVDAGLRVKEEIFAPNPLNNLFARDELALLFSQQDEQFQWLPFQTNSVARTAQCELAGIQLEIVETE